MEAPEKLFCLWVLQELLKISARMATRFLKLWPYKVGAV
jgi:hypothetical protein